MPVHYQVGSFPPQNLDWPVLIPLLGATAAAIARYDGALAAVPNPDVLLAPLTTREAALSSRIEGTQATMGEVLEFEAGVQPDSTDRRDDIQEVLNYRRAMARAEKMLQELPMCLRVVREAHEILMSGARGAGKSPAEYRRIPNWIGPPGCGMEEATFVPIGADRLVEAMTSWERFVHEDAPDRLVQIALLHAEFEALHPFLDGNGRLGRMLVPLFLWRYDLIREPMFYISAHFESHRDAYCSAYRRRLLILMPSGSDRATKGDVARFARHSCHWSVPQEHLSPMDVPRGHSWRPTSPGTRRASSSARPATWRRSATGRSSCATTSTPERGPGR